MNKLNKIIEYRNDSVVLRGLNFIQKRISSFKGIDRALNTKTVLKALTVVQKEKGVLSKDLKKQCDDYAIKTLGSIKYAPILYVYTVLHGEFKEGWIPEGYYIDQIRVLDGIFEFQGDMRALSNRVLETDKLPDLLYIQNQKFIEPKSYEIISDQDAIKLLFKESDKVIFKSNNSMRGTGIKIYNKNQLNLKDIKLNSGVFQKIIDQHSFFDNIFPHPGATVRITTALDFNGVPTVRGANLRLGRSSNNTGSTHVQSSNAVKVAIDLETGMLFNTGYLADWSSTCVHPDTGVSFSNLVVPAFKEACIVVEQLHRKYPFVRCIGWDISINKEDQIEIMEWNTGNNALSFHQATHGPCFKDFLKNTHENT